MGLEVIDLTTLGWDGSEEVARRVTAELRELTSRTGIVCVLDLFTSTSYRFKQSDGGLALPIKINGKFHLLGDLAVCEDSAFKATVAKCIPVLAAVNGPMVVLPPLPRFLGGGCCEERSHAQNSRTAAHAEEHLKKILHLRRLLRTELSGSTLENFWVADPAAILTECDKIGEPKAEQIIPFFVGDNVHLTAPGYSKLVEGITQCFARAAEPVVSASVNVSGAPAGRYFWRGFSSPNGSVRPNNSARNYKLTGGGSRGQRHPYRGK